MRPLRIGILLNPKREMMDFEARIFSALFDDEKYEVVCTIKDGKNSPASQSIFQPVQNEIKSSGPLKAFLLLIIDNCEKQLIKKLKPERFDKQVVTGKVSALPCIELMPERPGIIDSLSNEDCARIEGMNLDVLLRHEFTEIKGEILTIPKYGIWSLHHGDDMAHRGYPGGFWEAYNSNSVTCVTLKVLDDKVDNARVIQKGIYNTEKFWYLNFEKSLDNSVALILKHLGLLYESRELKTFSNGVSSNRPSKFPSFYQSLNYSLKTYSAIIFRKLKRSIYRAFGVGDYYDVWKLHIGKGNMDNSVLGESKTIEPPRNEFWADPFLFEYKKKTYVFFEIYEYSKDKGKISVGIIEDDEIIEVTDCIDVDYHLSYPFLFEHENELFMIPETSQMKRLEIWKCNDFPSNWSLEKTCFEGEEHSLVDSTIAKDSNNQFWLFTNVGSGKFSDNVSNLSVFKIDSPMMNEIIPHKLNPVSMDCRSARNAGNIFTDNKGRLIRPSQANQNGVYGECLNLCHVKELTIDTYEEEIIETITPEFKNGLGAVHHVSQAGSTFVVDGCYRNR
jgi:hypothetical protein